MCHRDRGHDNVAGALSVLYSSAQLVGMGVSFQQLDSLLHRGGKQSFVGLLLTVVGVELQDIGEHGVFTSSMA